MKKLRILGLSALFILLIGFAGITSLYRNSWDDVAKTQGNCGNEVWVIERDSPFHDIYERNLSDTAGTNYLRTPSQDGQRSFTCDMQTAEHIVQFEKAFQFSIYLLFLPLWLPLVLIGTVGWWLRAEWRTSKKRRK